MPYSQHVLRDRGHLCRFARSSLPLLLGRCCILPYSNHVLRFHGRHPRRCRLHCRHHLLRRPPVVGTVAPASFNDLAYYRAMHRPGLPRGLPAGQHVTLTLVSTSAIRLIDISVLAPTTVVCFASTTTISVAPTLGVPVSPHLRGGDQLGLGLKLDHCIGGHRLTSATASAITSVAYAFDSRHQLRFSNPVTTSTSHSTQIAATACTV